MKISSKRGYKFLNDLDVKNFDSEPLKINHVIFGKKYIYLITDFRLVGDISGNGKDNSWFYYSQCEKTTRYINNITNLLDKNIRDFAGILSINADPIVSIALMPNQCELRVENANKTNCIITNIRKIKSTIMSFEKKEIGELDSEQINQKYMNLKVQNEQQKR